MKKNTRFAALASALALTGVLVGASVAANGDESDPLVTLSYLNKVVVPQVVSQVEESTAVRQSELEQKFTDQIGQYKTELEGAIGNQQQGEAAYTLVTMKKGQTMSLEVGCELMLRVGSAKVNSHTNPALIDIATAENVKNGTSLTKNHLYMATIPDRTLSATADTVKLLVRGGYTVK